MPRISTNTPKTRLATPTTRAINRGASKLWMMIEMVSLPVSKGLSPCCVAKKVPVLMAQAGMSRFKALSYRRNAQVMIRMVVMTIIHVLYLA